MDSCATQSALGAISLALVLVAWSALSSLPGPAHPGAAFEPTATPPTGADPRSSAALGWPVSCDEADPAVWAELRGVGPTRAASIAAAARRGMLREPQALLQVDGIGVTMAGKLTPRIQWSSGSETN